MVASATISTAEFTSLFHASGHSSAPAYQRVKNLITEQIRMGSWCEGDLLPSENQLTRSLGLSRMTVNRAFRELSAAGHVNRLVGVGTFIAGYKASSALFEVRNIADEIAGRAHQHRAEVMLLRREVADSRVHRQLDIAEGLPVFHSLLIHFENDLAIQLEDRLVNPEMAPDYVEQDFTAETPNTYLSKIAPLGRGEHVVEAALGSADDCRLLGIDESEPCLVLQRRTWSTGRLVSTARLVHPGSRYRLEGTFDA